MATLSPVATSAHAVSDAVTDLLVAADPDPSLPTAVVVERMPLVRLGLETSLERAGVASVGQADALEAGVAMVRETEARLLVVGGVDDARPGDLGRHLADLPGTDAVVLMDTAVRPTLVALLEAGVMGVALRSIGSEDLAALVRTVLGGERAVVPALVSVLVGLGPVAAAGEELPATVTVEAGPVVVSAGRIAAGEGASPLTSKELAVLGRLAQGESNAAIADALFVSVPTVKTHLAHIYAKLGVGGRHEAMSRAVALGLLH